jgi:hypothetical protein
MVKFTVSHKGGHPFVVDDLEAIPDGLPFVAFALRSQGRDSARFRSNT